MKQCRILMIVISLTSYTLCRRSAALCITFNQLIYHTFTATRFLKVVKVQGTDSMVE